MTQPSKDPCALSHGRQNIVTRYESCDYGQNKFELLFGKGCGHGLRFLLVELAAMLSKRLPGFSSYLTVDR